MIHTTIHPQQDYLDFLAQGKFMLLRERTTGKYMYYPRVAAPVTGSTDLEWSEATGQGSVYSFSFISQRPPTPDYNIVLIDLDEGPKMMSRVEGVTQDSLKIGMRVQARIIIEGDTPIVVFGPK